MKINKSYVKATVAKCILERQQTL